MKYLMKMTPRFVIFLPDGVITFVAVSTYDLCDMLVAGVTITFLITNL